MQVLGAADHAALRDMPALFGKAFEDPEQYGARPPGEAYLRLLLERDSFVTLTAFEGPRLGGGLAGNLLPKFEQERCEFCIHDLAVDAAHRRCGVATALIQELQRQARRRGSGCICVQADRGDDPAIALYSRLGRREGVLHFDIAPTDA
jgi:aminoglycoside 3-N-acetyltransferase I